MNDLFDLFCPICGEGENLAIETVEEGAVVRIPFGTSSDEAIDETIAKVFHSPTWDTPLRCGGCDRLGPIHSFDGRIAEWMRSLKWVEEHHPELDRHLKGGAR